MDSVAAPTQIEGLDAVLPMLEEARHEEALPLIEENLSKNPDVVVWKYLKALVIACQARGAEGLDLLKDCSSQAGFSEGFGLPADVNTLTKVSALNHLHFETTVEPDSLKPWDTLEEYARILQNEEFLERCAMGRWKTQPENEEAYKKFESYFGDRDPKEYVKLIGQVMSDNSDCCLPKAILGAKMQEIGKTALAIRHLKDANEANPEAWQPHYFLGQVFASQERYENAETQFTEAMELRGEPSAELYKEIAACQKATYRFEEAAETLFQSAEEFPQEFKSWDNLSEIAEAVGLQDRYAETLAAASMEITDNPDLVARTVSLALQNGDPIEAKRLVDESGIKEEPGRNADLAKLAADVSLHLLEPEEAVSLLESALKAHADSQDLRLAYGDALLACARSQDAEVVLKETALQHPNERTMQIAWGRALLATGEAERAHRAFGLASRLDPEDPEAMTEQAIALLELGNYSEATPILKEAAKKVDPPLAVTLIGLGRVYEKKGLRDISKDFYRQALAKDLTSRAAAGGWFRLHSEPSDVKSEALEAIKQHTQDFYKARLFLNLLHSALWEGLAETARLLVQEVLGQVRGQISSGQYKEFLESNLFRRVPQLAARLEREEELERAREVWRFGVTSSDSELSQKATAELLRLDTVEATLAVPEDSAPPSEATEPTPVGAPVSEAAPIAGDDPLLSLLSTTLPVDAPMAPAPADPVGSEVKTDADTLFAAPIETPPPAASGEAPLFAQTPDVIAPKTEEAALFATSPEQATEESLFATTSDTGAEAAEASLFAQPESASAAVSESGIEADAAVPLEAPAVAPEAEAAVPMGAPAAAPETEAVVPMEAPEAEVGVPLDAPAAVPRAEAAVPLEAPAAAPEAEAAVPMGAPEAEAAVPLEAPPVAPEAEVAVPLEAPAAAPEAEVAVPPEAPAAAPQAEVAVPLEAPAAAHQAEVAVPLEAPAAAPQAEVAEAPAVAPEAEVIVPQEVPAEAPPTESVAQDATVVPEASAPAVPVTATQPSESQSVQPTQAEVAPAVEVANQADPAPSLETETPEIPSPAPVAASSEDQLAAELDLTLDLEDDETATESPATEPSAAQAQPEVVEAPVAHEPPDAEGKDLLPIMAVDFDPNTRRQLHFHEALTQSQNNLVTPEAIAHLMVTSSLAHEPPDPSSANQDSLESLLHALLRSAQGLGQQQQFRAASRLLKTGLLYSPQSPEVTNALLDIQVKWAHWLTESGEFAHAVGLIRDSLRRAPSSPELEAELEKVYQAWMSWSDQKGDPAARDLLAVYLQQEQASLQQFRAQWQQQQAQPKQQAEATPSAPPAVEPTMPATSQPSAPSEPETAAQETTAPEPTPAEVPVVEAAPEVSPQPTPEVVAEPSATVADTTTAPVVAEQTPAAPAAEPTPVESTPTTETATAPEPTPVAEVPVAESAPEPAPVEQTPVAEAVPEEAVTTAPEAPAATAPAADASSAPTEFASDDDALAALDASPDNEAVGEAVFAHFADSMRTLTTALRDRVSSHSDQPLWLLLLARAFRRSGSETMAVIQYQKYIKAAPTPDAYEELAQTYEEIGKEDFAKMTRRKAERAFSY